ncbi:MAG: hypothetical protein CMJ31_13090 [Phycisphaerae bacterium]|nr:hypothetical protein [Phycisphaerae bacterium]
MRIAITGAAGFIGSHLCRRLAGAGHTIVGFVRESSQWSAVQPYCERFVFGDQSDESKFLEFCHDADAVVHNSFDWSLVTGGYRQRGGLRRHMLGNLVSSLRLLELSHPRPFVYLSSVAVHHDILPEWDHKPDEAHPLRPSSAYGACKAAVEAHLWAEHFERDRATCAVRPCAVYGMDPKLDRTIGFSILRQIIQERHYEKSGGGKFVHVDDVTAAIHAALERPERSAGKPFHLADCYARWTDLAQWGAELLKIRPEIVVTSEPDSVNHFDKTAAKSLGPDVDLERGHDGLRAHLEQLVSELRRQGLDK